MSNYHHDQCPWQRQPDTGPHLQAIHFDQHDMAKWSPGRETTEEIISSSAQQEYIVFRFGCEHLEGYLETCTLAQIEEDLSHPNWRRRFQALAAIEFLTDTVPLHLVPLIVHNLCDDIADVRAAAAQTLALLGEHAPRSPLILAMADYSELVRASVVHALGKLGPRMPLETLLHACNDEDAMVRTAAVHALVNSPQTLPVTIFATLLKDEDFLVRLVVAQTLHGLGERAPIEILLLALHDEDEDVRMAVLQALGERLHQVPVPVMITLLTDKCRDIRLETIRLLRTLKADIPVEPLILALKHSSKSVQDELLMLLGELQPAIPLHTSLSFLLKCLTDSDQQLRTIAAWALGEKQDIQAVTPLLSVLSDECAEVRTIALSSLQTLFSMHHAHSHIPADTRDKYYSALLCNAVINYLQDKRGFVYPASADTADERTLILVCGYQHQNRSFQDVVLQLLQSYAEVRNFDAALSVPDQAVRLAAQHSIAKCSDRPWAEMFMFSLVIPDELAPNFLARRIVLCSVGYERVRSTDGPLLDELLSAYHHQHEQSGSTVSSSYQQSSSTHPTDRRQSSSSQQRAAHQRSVARSEEYPWSLLPADAQLKKDAVSLLQKLSGQVKLWHDAFYERQSHTYQTA